MTDNVVSIEYGGKEITLIGKAHVLQEIAELVKQTIDTTCPDAVCIELDVLRYKNIQNPEAWKNTNVADIRKPTVEDVNNVPDDIFHITRLFKNRFLKALAIVFFSNIESAIGTFIAGTDMIRNMF